MLLVASALALLVVYAGVNLLIQTKKETLGNRVKCAAWFFIIAGFLILACAGACCIAMCCRYGSKMMRQEHKMMGGYENEDMKEHFKHYKKMMKYHRMQSGEGCVVNINCCSSEMEKCCDYRDACKPDTMKYNRK
jgi:hypothetical protein